jgi:hypothetical protein
LLFHFPLLILHLFRFIFCYFCLIVFYRYRLIFATKILRFKDFFLFRFYLNRLSFLQYWFSFINIRIFDIFFYRDTFFYLLIIFFELFLFWFI